MDDVSDNIARLMRRLRSRDCGLPQFWILPPRIAKELGVECEGTINMPEYENNSVQLLNHNSIPQERKELLAKLCCDAKQFLFTQLDDKYAPTFWNDLSPEKKRAWIEDIEHWIERNNMPLYSMHQYWVLQMSAEGWSFGPDGKDEENKKHPHIVPWEMLPPYARAGYALSRAIISQLMND